MTAPTFLMRCPRCFAFHQWRAARHDAFTTERIVPHQCPHGIPCIIDCAHGKALGVNCSHVCPGECKHERDIGCCTVEIPKCPQCEEIRAQVYAKILPRPECLVCREVKRQGGSGCPTFKTKVDNGWTVSVPDPLCRWRRLERMPPWCAGATDAERTVFLSALPVEIRQKAIDEARKANVQVGAEQRHEKKVVEKKKSAGQTSMF